MKLYSVPFNWDSISEDIDTNTIFQLMENNGVEFIDGGGHSHDDVHGNFTQLANFFQELDGPAQSFPIDEFKEWVELYEVDENRIPV